MANTTTINTKHAHLIIRVLETQAFTSKTNPNAFFAYLRCTMPDASKYIARAFGTEDRGEFYLDLYAVGETQAQALKLLDKAIAKEVRRLERKADPRASEEARLQLLGDYEYLNGRG